MLKIPKNALIQIPRDTIYATKEPEVGAKINEISVKINANTKLTAGPATEIIPFCLIDGLPNIITAPGARNRNPVNAKKIANVIIIKSPLNSEMNP